MSFLKALWSKPVPLDEQVKQWRSDLRSESRGVDRQIRHLERAENKLKIEIKNLAKRNQLQACKTLAVELVRSGKAKSRMYQTKAHINSVVLQLNTQLANIRMTHAIQASGEAMATMNQLVRVKDLNHVCMRLGREMEKAGFIEEMIDDVTDVFDDEELEDAADQQVQQVLEELTAGILNKADIAPSTGIASQQQQAAHDTRQPEAELELPSVPI